MTDTHASTKVSVCIVTYNQERYIRDCLQSLVDQVTDFGFELIVSDDCSTDHTRSIILEYAERYPNVVKPILHAQNMGAFKNFIFVHEQARGEYVAHMDGDDYALPGKLQAQTDILDMNARCTAVWHRVDYFDDAGGFCSGETADLSMFENGTITFADAIRLGFIGVHSSLMYRQISRTPVDRNQRILDLYVTWDLLAKGNGHFIDEVLGRYRVGASGSLTAVSLQKIRLLSLDHAKVFFDRFPQQRKSFLLWAICIGIVDAKNRRKTALDFMCMAWRARTWVTPAEILTNLRHMRNSQVQWRRRRQLQTQRATNEI